MSAPETATKFSSPSFAAGGQQVAARSNRQAAAPPASVKLRLDLNLEVEIAIQAKVNGDITLSLLHVAAIGHIPHERSEFQKFLDAKWTVIVG
ncbi:hypothetical protein IW261DRAFT_1613214 [Armillaria novae-zelandiae]|uniref:Uncharacterized protein n=2 Tax=Armillaria novae-zelandiae TaxID=153914 RepID=A0AA39NJ05_9AGAR|nr:hypothetical protein IW261DRAFT_1613214 [Armillaria novae-zelandiae]